MLLQLLRWGQTAWTLQQWGPTETSGISLFETYAAQVLLVQSLGLLGACGGVAGWRWQKAHILSVLLVLVGVMLCMGMSGHVVSASQEFTLSVAGMVHVLLAQLWIAGLCALLFLSKHHSSDALNRLAAFSKVALPGMGLLLLSGVVVGRWSVGSWPGLWATDYGAWLLFKLCAVMAALWCAWQLRRSLGHHPQLVPQQHKWLQREMGLSLVVLITASVLAATVPAAHDAIVWPWSFRLAPVLAWRQDPSFTMQMLAAGAVCWAMGMALWMRWKTPHPLRAQSTLAACTVAGWAVVLPALSITAYPTTYMHSSARLDAPSVMAGQSLYQQHCVQCHGVHGHGDGPVAKANKLQPANLTEPHVSWHTHGDMYWWLSHGKGRMPGFANVLTEDERWHLINWLIALSLGYEARTVTHTPAPFNPWLPSIDFRFQMDNNNFMSLSEWRGLYPVHLIIVNQHEELQRVRELLKDMKGFPAQLVIVSRPEWLKDLVKGPCEAILVGDAHGEIANAWAHYRRSFATPDLLNEESVVPRMEFLIDRFGFVRARWRSDETPNALSLGELKVIYDSLAPEGEIKSAAIHQHD